MKNKYPVISFWVMCLITILAVFYCFYEVKILVNIFDGLKSTMAMLSYMAPKEIILFFVNNIITPLLFCVTFISFTVCMGRKVKIGSGLFTLAFVAAVVEFGAYLCIVQGNYYSVFSLLLRILFLALLFLLVVKEKQMISEEVICKISYISAVAVLIHLVIFYSSGRAMLFQYIELEGLKSIDVFAFYIGELILPFFRPLAFALTISYSLLYEKMFEKEQNPGIQSENTTY